MHPELTDFSGIEEQLAGYDACFFCLGVSSAGMNEADYRRVTYDITLAAAGALVRVSPGMTFIYVSGSGTDSSGKGRVMWARVKGGTENALLALPFRAAYMFRPAFIQPLHGVRSKVPWIRVVYVMLAPLTPLLLQLFPKYATTTEVLGRAMIKAARDGAPKHVLENRDINLL